MSFMYYRGHLKEEKFTHINYNWRSSRKSGLTPKTIEAIEWSRTTFALIDFGINPFYIGSLQFYSLINWIYEKIRSKLRKTILILELLINLIVFIYVFVIWKLKLKNWHTQSTLKHKMLTADLFVENILYLIPPWCFEFSIQIKFRYWTILNEMENTLKFHLFFKWTVL